MKIVQLDTLVSEESDGGTFTGLARLTRMMGIVDQPKVNGYRVEFQPSSRTAWHTHSGHQILVVISGRCRFQSEQQDVCEVGSGDLVLFSANEMHWHGATPDAPMVHLALNIDATTRWFQKVTDAEYGQL